MARISLNIVDRSDGVQVLRVQVTCNTRPELSSYVDTPMTEVGLRKRASVAAGAIVEQHVARYGDTADPDAAARAAEELFDRLGLPS